MGIVQEQESGLNESESIVTLSRLVQSSMLEIRMKYAFLHIELTIGYWIPKPIKSSGSVAAIVVP